MARKQRIDPEGAWHHVMNRGVDRGAIYFDDHDRIEFGRLLGIVPERYAVEIHAYCLMGNHFHLLLRCPDGRLSEALQYLTSLYARSVNERHDRVGHLFGSRFASRLITTDRYLLNTFRYIHRNPLDISGVQAPSHYRWSSHRTYLDLRRAPDWLSTEQVLRRFGNDRDALDSFVSGAGRSRVAPETTAREMLAAIDLVQAERSSQSSRSAMSERRALALTLSEDLDDRLQAEVRDHLGLVDAAAARTAMWRARTWLSTRPDSRSLLPRIVDLLASRYGSDP